MELSGNLKKSYFPGKVLQSNDAIMELPALIEMFGQKAYVLVTPSMATHIDKLGVCSGQKVEVFAGPCCWREINRLIDHVGQGDYTVIVGIGGGKVVDTAKAVADKLGLRSIIAPSVAASSAPFSACSVIYSPENIYESVYHEVHSPDVLLIDNSIINNAKPRFMVAGMGDALSVYFESRGCYKNSAPNSLHGRQNFIAMALGRYCFDTLIKYGKQAKLASEAKIITPALERIIEVNVFGSGIAFEGGGLAAAHAIHNGLTIIPAVHDYLHGEIVAFAVLAELHLTDAEPSEMEQVYHFCEEVGLPTTLADLGIGGISDQELFEAAKLAGEDEYMPHEGKDITAEKIFAAIKAADMIGIDRKNK